MNIWRNIIKVCMSRSGIIWILIWILVIIIPSFYFIEKEIIIPYLWYNFYILELTLVIIISILFWIFLWSTFYKIQYFQVHKTGLWFTGWFLWILVSWCPACSITLASYLWLGWFISIFPYYWLELKFLSLFMLIYANYYTLNNLQLCKIKVRN